MPSQELTIVGDRAAITGAGSGIGRTIAEHLAEIGVDVAINDVDEDALEATAADLAELDGTVITYAGDASSEAEMQSFIETCVSEFGGLDILVNNVGVAGPTKSCEELTNDEFMWTLSVNLGGLFNTTSAAIPYLKDGEGGRIVNISSMSGKRPLRDRTPYTTSKMGVIGFTRTLAVELADNDINVNAICPGSVKGPRLDAVIEKQARNQGRSFEDVADEFRSASPKDEFVTATDIAETVALLCSEQTEKMTGQDINVTSGIVMY